MRRLFTEPRLRIVALISALALLGALLTGVCAASRQSPGRWPFATLQLGLMDPPGDAAALRASAPFGLRYQYLSAGVNTGESWQTWGNGSGSYVSDYIAESEANQLTPVFSYYELRQSDPGNSVSDEARADLENLQNPQTMRAYYEDLKAFFQRAANASGPVILQFEPDVWGYIEQQNANASSVPASVSSSGMPDLQGMPNTAAGFAQAALVLRDNYAPRVMVAYPVSIWGTGKDIHCSQPSDAAVDRMAAESAAFYRSLHSHYDLVFTETSNSDAAYAQIVDGKSASAWWNASDFARDVRYLGGLHRALGLPIVVWQIPVGNTVMRAENNTPYHYQDLQAQTLLWGSRASRALLSQYVGAGVVALLFGSGQATDTCACDAQHQGVTNPPPIDGNARYSLSSDDDGGLLKSLARAYYRHPLPDGRA